jgi:hypothetical protein
MKKLFLAIVIGVIAIPASAQFEQGKFLLGGAFGLDFKKLVDKDNGQTTEIYRSRSLTFDPDFGYFVANRFAIGAGLSISNTRLEYRNSGDVSTREDLTFSPLLRYYLPNKIFFQLRIPLGGAATTIETDGGTSRRTSGVRGLALAAGYAIMLNSDIALEPMLQYSSVAYRDRNSSDRDVENTLSLRMGFQIYLGR